MPRKPDRPAPADCTSGDRFPWTPIDRGTDEQRQAARQQAAVARWVIEQMTTRRLAQRDLERAGVASQSTISGLVTGRSWTDMWVVARTIAHLGGQLTVRTPTADREPPTAPPTPPGTMPP